MQVADSGPGSLRAAVEAEGPRTVVFRVGGTIELLDPLSITEPAITIAGQTAPGGGILLKVNRHYGGPFFSIETGDVIVRHLRIRPGPTRKIPSSMSGLLIRSGARAVIIDHCSISWASDETVGIGGDVRDITVQWSAICEGLVNSTLGVPHGSGLAIADQRDDGLIPTRITLHHNLFANNRKRNPQITGSDTVVDCVNNVVYNHGIRALGLKMNGRLHVNYAGNFIVAGPSTEDTEEARHAMYIFTAVRAPMVQRGQIGPKGVYIYEQGNAAPRPMQGIDRPDWAPGWRSPERFEAPRVAETSAEQAFEQVLKDAGATLPRRDAVDLRILKEIASGGGRLIDHPDDVGGWPEISGGEPYPDGDGDGMADPWERNFRLDPADDSDGAADSDGDRFTNLEEFLNQTDPRRPDR